jgi:MFS family permease
MRKIPQGAGLYLAVLQLVFTLGWTVYAIYLPRLAASVGIAAGAVIYILMLDQAIFTVTDFAMGVAADKVSRVIGRLGHWVVAITLVSCLAFVALPYVAGAHLSPAVLLALTFTWAVTSSALRAPPMMLLGKYAARPALPYLASIALAGLGIAGALAPYLTTTLAKEDPRLPFIIASGALVVVSLALSKVERGLAKDAPTKPGPPTTVDRAVSTPTVIFALAMVIFALGFQLHFFFNTAPRFKHFTNDIGTLMPVFWVGFSLGMFPASLITRRWGGLPVMGLAALIGAIAIVVMASSGTLEIVVAAQFTAGAAWGCILMSAFATATALGYGGHEGKTTGILFSTLAIATFARMAMTAAGVLNNPALAPLLQWAPIACWAVAGAVLMALSVARIRRKARA